jgi:transcriptional regulator with XRE-family HTH domain
MSHADLAEYLGVPQTTLSNWQNGTRTPSQSCLRLLDVLGTIEALAPTIHAALLPSKRVDKRTKGYRDAIGRIPHNRKP